MISVIMSTHNRGKKIKRAIESILNQSLKDFEFIICDDHSDDDTLNIIKRYSEIDSRIKIIINKKNIGLQKSLNKCIKESSGEYIARMDDDDYSCSNRLEKELEYMKLSGADFVGSNIDFFSNELGVYGQKVYPEKPTKIDLIKSCVFCHPSILIKSSIIKKYGGYSESKKHLRVEDYELWLRLYKNGCVGQNIQEPLLVYTKDINSIKNIRWVDRIHAFNLLNEYFHDFKLSYGYYLFIVYPLIKFLIPTRMRTLINYIKYKK
ncbi:glycosyltransferase [Apilactobacillus kunkeei]|nr:glycosyltransferase [Apilactobacillus kunkeei]TMT01281.1 glycosyltransferase [Apilactobacillus kunkeei]